MKSFIVMTPDPALKAAWLSDLRQVIVERSERSRTIQQPGTGTSAQPSHAPMLVGDNASTVCQRCEKKFSLTVRKNHCMSCGKLCCSECVANKMSVRGGAELQRVCNKCAGKEETAMQKAKSEAKAMSLEAMEKKKEGDREKEKAKEREREREREREKENKKDSAVNVEQKDILGIGIL